MVWNICPVNEYEAQSAIIPFAGIIVQKEYELRQDCHFMLIFLRVATPKDTNFSRRQNVLLIVRSQYRYKLITKGPA
jgi:hypothetical protein